MITVRKKDKETTGSLLRRFSRRVQQSRVLLDARVREHHQRPKSKARKRREASKRDVRRKEYERLSKLGKV